jgi:enoyl-CoA hydratase/carnithine racemase
MTDKLLVEKHGHIAVLTLNMPDLRNPITDQDVVEALVVACEDVSQDMSIRCVILTGAGKGFSSGGNLKHMQKKSGIFGGDALAVKDGYRNGIQRVPKALWNLEVPVIAAVNGPAYGAGCDLAMMADIRIASTKATFAENFVRVGIIPGDGGSWLLPRQIGLSRAAEMTFTAEPVKADKALEWGLVSQVVQPEDLMTAALELAGRIAKNPPKQLRLSKRLMREALHMKLEPLLEMAAAYQGACHQTNDHEEAVNSLIEKRDAVFNGD